MRYFHYKRTSINLACHWPTWMNDQKHQILIPINVTIKIGSTIRKRKHVSVNLPIKLKATIT